MSANFIIRYAGAGVTFKSGAVEIVDDHRADTFISEADAWLEARKQGLNLDRVTVPNLYLEDKQAAQTN